MKKIIAVACILTLMVALFPAQSVAKVNRQPGGPAAFFVGCCWGLREGTQWNEGADMHWREWMRIVPVVGLVIAVWDGYECMQGVTAHEWAEKNGANWY